MALFPNVVQILNRAFDSTSNWIGTSMKTLMAGEDLDGQVLGVWFKPTANPIYSATPAVSAYASAAILVKASPGQLIALSCNNKNASERFLWVKSKATVIASSDTVTSGKDLVFPLPASTNGLIDFTNFLKQHGVYFDTGITIGVSTSATSFTAGTAADHYIAYQTI